MSWLNKSCDLYRNVEVEGSFGVVDSLTLSAADVKCRVLSGSYFRRKRLEIEAGGEVEVATHTFLFRPTETIDEGYFVSYGSNLYKVLSVVNPDETGHHLEVHTVHAEGLT